MWKRVRVGGRVAVAVAVGIGIDVAWKKGEGKRRIGKAGGLRSRGG